jgi:glycosyltransferase involved in cell wall biosynthesis
MRRKSGISGLERFFALYEESEANLVIRCASLGFPRSSLYTESRGEKFGAYVAQLDLADALLRESKSLLWDVWSSKVFSSLTKANEMRSHPSEVSHLKETYGDRVQIRPFASLPEILTDQRYIFLGNVPTFSRISDLRSQLGAIRMPICALTHSLYTKDLLSCYSWLLLSAEPHDVIVTSSAAGRRALEKWFAAVLDRIERRTETTSNRLKLPRMVEIPFGTNLPLEEELDRAAARCLLKIPANSFVILYFGRITEEYKADLDPLLQSAKHLDVHGHNPWLVLAGQITDRVYLTHLERRLASLGLRAKTILLENCPEFLKSSVYAASDVVVSPADSVQETFGLAILEAMAHSRPVVASNWSGYRELVEDGITGFLIQTLWTPEASDVASMMTPIAPLLTAAHYLAQRTLVDCGDLINRLTVLAEDPALATRMGKAGRERVEGHYTWSRVATRFLELWEEQFELAQGISLKTESVIMDNFRHYASDVLSPGDMLARISDVDELDINVLDSFIFYSQKARVQAQQLLEITSTHAMGIGELRQKGFGLDCILWTAKKGLRRIIKLPYVNDEGPSVPETRIGSGDG